MRRNTRNNCWINPGIWCALAWLLAAESAFAQRPAHTRSYRIDGSYAAAVSISPQGNVIVRSGDVPKVTWLDGFDRREIEAPEESQFRVYESRTSQLWSLYSDGLLLHQRGQWSYHPIAEVRNEMTSNPMRQLRQISLVPSEMNHVLILLPDKLLEYSAVLGRATVLKRAEDTGLGRFQEMTEGLDGGLWVSGVDALASLPGPVRRITAETPWREQPLSQPGLSLTLQRPIEHPPGLVVTVGVTAETVSRRFIVEARDDGMVFPIQTEKPRQAWRSWDNLLWSYSYNSLFRVGQNSRIYREPVVGAQFDVALETNGVFWIASAEGVTRYAPYLWRAPPELEFMQNPVHTLIGGTNDHRVWMVSPDGLVAWSPEGADLTPWPENLEIIFQPSDGIYRTPNGLIAIGTQTGPLLFDPEARRFRNLPAPSASTWRFVGIFADGSLCAWSDQGGQNPGQFWRFDGSEFHEVQWDGLELPGDEVTLFRQFERGDIWIGTDAGLVLIRASDGSVHYHGPDPDLPPERILSLAETGEDQLWCGTPSGIHEFRGQRWTYIHGSGERINSITRGRDGTVWVGTSSGVLRRMENAWVRYGSGDGLPSYSVYAVFRDRSDRIWAGTGRGVVRYHPEADPDPPIALPPVIIEPERPSSREPTVVSFSGRDKWDYSSPGELLYSYRLGEGSWSPFSNLVVRAFHNLSSGDHVLEVRAMDKTGNQSLQTGTLAFTVVMPWFRDPRLIVVSAIGVVAVLFFAGVAVNKHFQLKRSYAEVGRMVEQRTSELEKANQELLHSQKMKAIGTMAAGIAHDFNNILSIIKGSAQIIETNLENKDKIQTRVNRIQTVVAQGSSIVRALLGLGRLNEKELAECDVAEILEETRRVLGDRLPEGVRLDVRRNGDVPQVRCSREVLQQMLMNLVLNAVDAVGNGGSVEMMAGQQDKAPPDLVVEPAAAENYVVLSVRDTGCGIAPEALPRIFEPFYTTKAFSSRRGTGLGLSMVYELAKGVGYGLSVASSPGQGSTFRIIIPRKPAEPPAAP